MRTPLLFALSLALLGPALAPATAQADESVVVLGITSMEGDDELARNLTGALRHAASQVHGWQVSDSEVTLAQMSLAHGCSDEPDPSCLAQISSALGAQRLVYGILRRDGSAFSLSLSSYAGGEIERTVTERIPGGRTDIDDLRDPARQLMAQLSGPTTGSLRVASNAPNATVSIDGSPAGTTDASGAFVASAVPVGDHSVTISASGYETWTGPVTIARDTETNLDAPLTQSTGGTTPGGSGEGPGIGVWIGAGLLGVAVASFAVTVYSWARLNDIENDPTYVAYRSWPGMAPANVCETARAGMPNGSASPTMVANLCNEADTLEVLQYVFLGVAAAAAAGGTALIITGVSGGSGESDQAFMLMPSVSPDGARVQARIRF